MSNNVGRPTLYSLELVTELCNKIAGSNKGLHSICKENPHFPAFSTIFQWLADEDKKEFADLYTRAKKIQAEFLVEEMLQIADDTTEDRLTINTAAGQIEVENKEFINRSRLRVDTRKFIASKLQPQKYGDKLDVTTDGKAIQPNIIIDLTGFTNEEIRKLATD